MNTGRILLGFLLTYCQSAIAQVVILPSNSGYPSFFGTDSNKPAVFGYYNQENLVIAPPYGNIGVNTAFYQGNTLKFPTHAKLHVRATSSGHNEGDGQGPQLLLDQNGSSGFARLRFRNSRIVTLLDGKDGNTILQPLGRYWDIAGFGNAEEATDDKLNFFHSGFGNILTISGNGRVGIRTTSPESELDNRGFTQTGELSRPYKTKLVEQYGRLGACDSNNTDAFSLGIHEDRIIAVSVLVRSSGSTAWYGPGDRFNNHEYAYRVYGSTIDFNFAAVAGCQFLNRDFRIWVTYTNTDMGFGL